MSKLILTSNEPAGTPPSSRLHTYYDTELDAFDQDIRTLANAAAANGFPAVLNFDAFGCADGAYGRVGVSNGGEIYLALDETTSLRLDTIVGPGAYTLTGNVKFAGYLGNRVMFVDMSDGDIQVFDTDTLLWETEIAAPVANTHFDGLWAGWTQQMSPDGTIWTVGAVANLSRLYSWNGVAWTDHGLMPDAMFFAWTQVRIFALANDAVYVAYPSAEGFPGFGSTGINLSLYRWNGVGWTNLLTGALFSTMRTMITANGYTAGAMHVFADRTMVMWNTTTRRLQLLDLKVADTRLGLTTTPNLGGNPSGGPRIVGSAKEKFILMRAGTPGSAAHWLVEFSQSLLDAHPDGTWSLVGARTDGFGSFVAAPPGDDAVMDTGAWWNRIGGGDTSGWAPLALPPEITSVSQVETLLTVTFSEEMEQTGAPGTALLAAGSYTLTPLSGGAAVAVTAVEVLSATQVRLTIGVSTRAEDYRLTIVGALTSTAGLSATGEEEDFVSTMSLPRVLTIVATTSNLLRVTFDRDMSNNADLVDVSKYVIRGGLNAVSVTRVGATEVDVVTSEQVPKGRYSLTISP